MWINRELSRQTYPNTENPRVGGSIDSDRLWAILTLRAHFVRLSSLRELIRPWWRRNECACPRNNPRIGYPQNDNLKSEDVQT
jgi:hypothetical protein